VLVSLAGLSPAVVTESVYALAVLRRPPVIPHEIFIVTTADAVAVVAAKLLGSGGAIRRLADEYGLPTGCLRCGPQQLIVLEDRLHRPLRDIRTSADSQAAGEQIAGLLARLREDPRVELHCSLAGGRKTMGALLAGALQLVAQPGDRLYHVLVEPRFERIPEFFYPPRRPRRYRLDGAVLDSRAAAIDLAEIPIVRLGSIARALGVRGNLAKQAAQLEAAMDERLRPPPLELWPEASMLEAGFTRLRLAPQDFAVFAIYASLRAGCAACREHGGSGCSACHPTDDEIFDRWRPELLRYWRRAGGRPAPAFEQILTAAGGSDKPLTDFREWIRQARARIARKLGEVEAAFAWRPVYGVSPTIGRRGLLLSPTLVRVRSGHPGGSPPATAGVRTARLV
jgi:CRISPR-associated protein (TIGR02584 family)